MVFVSSFGAYAFLSSIYLLNLIVCGFFKHAMLNCLGCSCEVTDDAPRQSVQRATVLQAENQLNSFSLSMVRGGQMMATLYPTVLGSVALSIILFAGHAFARCRDYRAVCAMMTDCTENASGFSTEIEQGHATDNAHLVWQGLNDCNANEVGKSRIRNQCWGDCTAGCSDDDYLMAATAWHNRDCNQLPAFTTKKQ
jgi:hypothetical protein